MARALRDLHDFLIRNYGVEPDIRRKYILGKKKNKALSVSPKFSCLGSIAAKKLSNAGYGFINASRHCTVSLAAPY